MQPELIHRAERHRFEWEEDGLMNRVDYLTDGAVMVLTHVEVDPGLRGRGVGSRLMGAVMEHVRANGLKVRPVCGFAAAYLQWHQEHADLVES
jgi:predicted GNAT family acetyltransferase